MNELVESASERHRAGDLEGAAALWEQVLAREPSNVAALQSLGLVLSQRGEYRRAVEFLGRATAMRPTAPALHVNLAEAYRNLGEFPRAAGCCRTALMLRPDFPEGLCTLGLIFHGMGRQNEAVEQFRRALAIRPEMAGAHNNLGMVLREVGAIDEAITHFRLAVQAAPGLTRARVNLGLALLDRGQAEESLPHFQEAVRAEPDAPVLYVNLGNALRTLNRHDEARAAYLEALRLDPELPFPHLQIGVTLRHDGRFDDALPWYKNALALNPENPVFWMQLGELHGERDEPEDAVPCWERALALSPSERAATHIGLGAALQDSGRPSEAKEHFLTASRLRPDLPVARLYLGGIHEEIGALDEAEAEFRTALELQPDSPLPLARLGTLLRGELPDHDLGALENKLADRALGQGPRARLLFALSHVLDARGDYARAADCVRQANALTQELAKGPRSYLPEEHDRWVDGLLPVFDEAFFARTAGWGHTSRRPVFVFGLPRSGTTLIEQVLASHPLIHGAGELRLARQSFDAMPSALGRTCTPRECIPDLNEEAVRRLAAEHLGKLDALDGGNAARVVDKMPDNYAYLGLLATLFPNAIFIHCRRDLRDVAVSCWMTDFRSIRWSCAHEFIAARFRQYRRLMDHWRSVLPVALHEVDYEETVNDLEGVARRLLAACDVAWDPVCLEFYRAQRPVRTASVTQVRQPIYTRSVARWKNYETHLADLFEALPIDMQVSTELGKEVVMVAPSDFGVPREQMSVGEVGV